MDRDIMEIVREIGEISRELDRTQKEITEDIVRSISSIQDMVRQTEPRREVVLERIRERVVLKEDDNTLFEGLY